MAAPLENRTRIGREIVSAVRKVWPENHASFHSNPRQRIGRKVGGTWIAVELARQLKPLGVKDLVDCSSAGLVVDQKIIAGPGFQVPFAERIRRDADILTAVPSD